MAQGLERIVRARRERLRGKTIAEAREAFRWSQSVEPWRKRSRLRSSSALIDETLGRTPLPSCAVCIALEEALST